MRRIFPATTTLLLIFVFGAAAAPKIPATQVSVNPALLSHTSSNTLQAVIKDLDAAIPGNATTTTAGTVRFSTPAEVSAGTSSTSAVTPADLKSKTQFSAMRYSGAVVFSGTMPTSFTDLDLSGVVGTNRAFVHLRVSTVNATVRFRENGETLAVGSSGIGDYTGTSAANIVDSGMAYVSLITDAAGVVEWVAASSTGALGCTVKLQFYQVLQ